MIFAIYMMKIREILGADMEPNKIRQSSAMYIVRFSPSRLRGHLTQGGFTGRITFAVRVLWDSVET